MSALLKHSPGSQTAALPESHAMAHIGAVRSPQTIAGAEQPHCPRFSAAASAALPLVKSNAPSKAATDTAAAIVFRMVPPGWPGEAITDECSLRGNVRTGPWLPDRGSRSPPDRSAQGGIRTRTPFGATPSRWCVYQFHHLGNCDAASSTMNRAVCNHF